MVARRVDLVMLDRNSEEQIARLHAANPADWEYVPELDEEFAEMPPEDQEREQAINRLDQLFYMADPEAFHRRFS
jgi:hypothetical protein